jgi:hypothetical protein
MLQSLWGQGKFGSNDEELKFPGIDEQSGFPRRSKVVLVSCTSRSSNTLFVPCIRASFHVIFFKSWKELLKSSTVTCYFKDEQRKMLNGEISLQLFSDEGGRELCKAADCPPTPLPHPP